ncbi:hypothetical protein [Pseudoxanthomonas dokdonensis]|uniref:Uncharacterized protein n=1 Tax=Pseudoxanthomonas dokdonensis TaxID=344882 RepID=A0A0R0CWZ1_9GAMM|nr:hypothetical protein [Pseudoxanthomonas dokdonensis]KRG69576.1 hypothetical protein ABB29_08855 [Pseudoxanthomonas dokdonensis]
MNTPAADSDAPLYRLLHGLSGRGLSPAQLQQRLQAVLNAYDDPALAWVDDPRPEVLMLLSLQHQLADHIAVAASTGALHAQVNALVSGLLPERPSRYPAHLFPPASYLRWLDTELQAITAETGGLRLLKLGNPYDENLHVAVVEARDLDEIQALAASQKLAIATVSEPL